MLKISHKLGWWPRVDFADGIARTIQWYLDHPAWLQAIADGTYQQ